MDNIKSLNELYLKIKPALKTKVTEAKRIGIDITEMDIWNYFSNKWSKSIDLDLNGMVKDILNLNLSEWRKHE